MDNVHAFEPASVQHERWRDAQGAPTNPFTAYLGVRACDETVDEGARVPQVCRAHGRERIPHHC